jgi:hypothetical protein
MARPAAMYLLFQHILLSKKALDDGEMTETHNVMFQQILVTEK